MVDFIGVGAQKSGTSWMYACLYEHPQICAPIKEIHFFSRPRFSKGKEWYEHHFRACRENTIKGEFSTSYLYSEEAPQRIAAMYPKVKIIAVLRNPFDRAYSQYRNAVKAGEVKESTTFTEYARHEKSVYEQGLYAKQLERYYKYFPREQVLVLIYEDIKKDPLAFIKRIYHFLGVDGTFVPSMLHTQVNVDRTPRMIFIDRTMHHVSEMLRKIGFDRIVWLIRKSGLPDFIRKFNTKAMDERSLERAKEHSSMSKELFIDDVARLSQLIGRDMSKEWKS